MTHGSTLARTRAAIFNRYTILVPAALAALWLFFLRNALDGTTSFALFIDNEFFLGPVLSSMSESLRSGEWPLRMDTVLGGLPLYNFTQLTAFYPLYLFALPLYESVTQSMHSMHMITVMHLLIMEINVYIFLRVIGVGRLPALTAAALATFSANSFSYAVWVNIIAPYAWFPLFLAGIAAIGLGKATRSAVIITVLGITMLAFASPAQPLIHAMWMAVVFCLFYGWHCYRHNRIRFFLHDFLLPLCGWGLLSFLIVAPALLPPALELKDMIRWVGATAPVYGTDRIPFAVFQVEQLAPADIGGVLFKFGDRAVGHQFAGLILMGLALISIFSPRRNWMVNALIFVAGYSLLSSFGSNFGLGYINYYIPMLNKIREPTRFLVLFHFAICALAALALEELRELADGKTGLRLMRRQWLALAILLGAALAVWSLLQQQIVAAIHPLISIGVLCLLLALTWTLPRLALPARGLLLASCWSVATLLTLALEVTWLPPPTTASSYATSNLSALDAALQRVAELDPSHDYRLIFDGSIDKQVAPMLASYHGIPTLSAYFNPIPREYFEELYYFEARGDNYMRMLGARYLLCKDCPAAALDGYAYTENIAGYHLYTAAETFPHSYVATAVAGTFEHLPDFIEKAGQLALDRAFVFVKASDAAALQLPDTNDGAGTATCSSNEELRRVNTVRISVDCSGAGVLVLNALHDGNWQVSVDGAKALPLKVNGNQIGARIGAGVHVVQFQYRPTIVTVTIVLSALSLLLTAYLLRGGRAGRWPGSRSSITATPRRV